MKRKITFIIFVFLIIFLSIGCGFNEKKFKEIDFEIILNNTFSKKELEHFNYYYQSKDAIVTVLKEDFKKLSVVKIDKNSTLEDYANAVIKNNNKKATLKERNNYIYFNYESPVNDEIFAYTAVVLKGKNSFWLINFGCLKEKQKEYADEFFKYADTIRVK